MENNGNNKLRCYVIGDEPACPFRRPRQKGYMAGEVIRVNPAPSASLAAAATPEATAKVHRTPGKRVAGMNSWSEGDEGEKGGEIVRQGVGEAEVQRGAVW